MSTWEGFVKRIDPYIWGIINTVIPLGVCWDFFGVAGDVPKGWIIPYGQDLEIAKYPKAYKKWGTTYGAGSDARYFKAPDLRGRFRLPLDNMGGSAASRVTSASTNGTNSTTLGGAGGSQTATLTDANMPADLLLISSGTASTENITAAGDLSRVYLKNPVIAASGTAAGVSTTPPWIGVNCMLKAT